MKQKKRTIGRQPIIPACLATGGNFIFYMTKVKIQDKSGDKEFFTMIPNFILNHSSANDQALYLQMKKRAGESGKCFTTEQTLMKSLSIGKKAYNKSLNYLLKRNWITFIGTTKGKTRPIKTYRIENIWHENSEYYKKISAESNVSKKDTSQKEKDTSQKQYKISAESNVEEEPIKEEPLIISSNDFVVAEDIIFIIDLFKWVSPNTYREFFKNTTERKAASELSRKFKKEEIEKLIAKALPILNTMMYIPKDCKAFKPSELYRNLDKILSKIKELRDKESNDKARVHIIK